MQRHQEIRDFFLQAELHECVVVVETTGVVLIFTLSKLVKHILQLGSELAEHLDDFFGLIVLRQASQRLEENRKAIKFVPQGQHHANLLDVVARRVAFEEVRLAAFLLLDVELGLFAHRVRDERLHEAFREDLLQDVRRHLENRENALIQPAVIRFFKHFLLARKDLQLSHLLSDVLCRLRSLFSCILVLPLLLLFLARRVIGLLCLLRVCFLVRMRRGVVTILESAPL